MKKNGFTLAEVLITLAIIGVVATMTLPALMNNVGEQQYITGLKKGINTLTEAAHMSKAVDGSDYSDLTSEDTTANSIAQANSLAALFRSRLNLDLTKTDDDRFQQGGNNQPQVGGTAMAQGNFAVYLRDGSAVYYPTAETIDSDNATRADDGLPVGYTVIYDVNGSKSPNVLSNCNSLGGTASAGAITTEEQGTTADCDTAANRVIGDQFLLRLRGTVVEPVAGAAEWAFNK